jgi:L-amino acid N-acyltransferase YncA
MLRELWARGPLRGTLWALRQMYSRRKFLVLTHSLGQSPSIIPPPGVVVREVARLDEEVLCAISRAWPAEFGSYRAEYLKARFCRRQEEGAWCLVARSGGRVAGAVWLSRAEPVPAHCLGGHNGCQRTVQSLFVCSSLRGKGVGKALLAEALVLARSRGVGRVASRILPWRTASLCVHVSLGFSIDGILIETTLLGRDYCHVCSPWNGRLPQVRRALHGPASGKE